MCTNRGIRCHSLSFVVIRGDSLSIVVFRVSFVAFYRVSFVATPCFNRGQAVVKGLNAQGDSINFPGFDESYSACLHCKTNNPISRSRNPLET